MSIRKTCKSKAFPISEDDTLVSLVKNSVSNRPFPDLAISSDFRHVEFLNPSSRQFLLKILNLAHLNPINVNNTHPRFWKNRVPDLEKKPYYRPSISACSFMYKLAFPFCCRRFSLFHRHYLTLFEDICLWLCRYHWIFLDPLSPQT